MEDSRFAHIGSDPKFKRVPKNERKVKIDKRFQSMFNDKKFKVNFTTDKRGRPIKQSTTEDLRRYYELSSEDESDSDNQDADKPPKAPKDEPSKELKARSKGDKNLSNDVKKKLKNLNVDYARGESTLYSESSSDDDEDDEDDLDDEEDDGIDHKWGELDNDAEETEDPTTRLAICNMDWDRIRALDLFVLFNSFLPPGTHIKSVSIYPSEFGKQRMAEEEVKGPQELVEECNKDIPEDDDDDNEEGSKYHMEKLRKYQLNRLKYYYAVAEFDSPSTANKVYTECDGMEYESSATKLDLRFIPEDMTFDDPPKESCDKTPELSKYEPRFFTTKALQQAKVDLTWDETNPERLEMAEKLNSGKLDDVTENDLNNYLAASSDEESESNASDSEDEEGGNPLDKYKALLLDIEEKEHKKKNRDVEMEVTWGLGLKQDAEKMVKKKLQEAEEKTPFQQYLDKRKEKRKEKRENKKNKAENEDDGEDFDSDVPSDVDMNDPYFAEEFQSSEFKNSNKSKKSINKKPVNDVKDNEDGELELLLMNEDDGQKHFNLKKIQEDETETKSKRKRKQKKGEIKQTEDTFEVDVQDSRFSALFTSHHYNIDPTDPHFRKTKAMDKLIGEKLKRRNDNEDLSADSSKKAKTIKPGKKKNAELSLLVKSVKRNTNAFKTK